MEEIQYYENNEIKIGTVSDDCKYVISNEFKTDLVDINEIKLLTPTEPGKIVCVGRNYAEHAAELGNELPKEPLLFLKAPSAIILENDFIEIPPQSEQTEHEGELGVVIGKTCKNLSDNEKPLAYVLGYICLNDVTARDLQCKDVQFTRAKSFDTFCPVSKFIKTGIDPNDLKITTKVNGILKQTGRTSRMVFSVGFLIKYISNQMTLNFGDIIATGTPAGVSVLKEGDICEVEIEGVGKISNPVRNAVKK
ncbi:fumarylacetoacetate hydrolase family protein [soil metagenome]